MQKYVEDTHGVELQLCFYDIWKLIYEHCYKVFNCTENEIRLNFFLLALELQSQHITID